MPSAERFGAAWRRLGGAATGVDTCARDLLAAWAEPHRRYHATSHLDACLALLDTTRATANRTDEIELGLWFHDAVYDTRARDNEERSAAWAERALAAGGLPADAVARVAAL